MKKQILFPLFHGRYLRRLDEKNWTVGYMRMSKAGNEYEELESFYPTLESAWRGIIDDELLTAKTRKELGAVIKQIKELKEPFFKNK
jgi:hypothetical protein